jgi:aarF domain-containing kinase
VANHILSSTQKPYSSPFFNVHSIMFLKFLIITPLVPVLSLRYTFFEMILTFYLNQSRSCHKVYRATLKHDLIPPSYLGPRRIRKSPGGPLGPVILQDPLPSVPTASVAIKVLHPNVEQYINRDLRIMYFFARCISLLPGMQWLSLPEEVQVFGSMMRQQLDLRNEADNLIKFEAHFAPRKVPVNFPRPLKVWSGKDILFEEYLNALPLQLFLRNGGGPFDEQIATVGLDAFLVCLFVLYPSTTI